MSLKRSHEDANPNQDSCSDAFCCNCEALLIDGINCDCGHKNESTHGISTTRVWFNRRKELLKPSNKDKNPDLEGPRVEKFCGKCNKLTEQTYFTAQLRSADEGQTVFYRCTECHIQTSENS